MDYLKALVLGIVQGLTEFLPVSSSGHLEIIKGIFSTNFNPKESLIMTVVLHFATALSTIFIFRKDIIQIISGVFSKKSSKERSFSLKIIVSMIPAGLVGVFFNDIIEILFDGQLVLVGFMLIITGVLLFFADRAKPTNSVISISHSFFIGIAQAIAILPGISRSGATIAISVILGLDKTCSAKFSFLMVVPLIFGKVAKDLIDGNIFSEAINLGPLIFGFVAAFFTGLFACKWMIGIVKSSKLKYFSYYCFTVAAIIIIFKLL